MSVVGLSAGFLLYANASHHKTGDAYCKCQLQLGRDHRFSLRRVSEAVHRCCEIPRCTSLFWPWTKNGILPIKQPQFLMLCRVLRRLWPLGKWKMEEEAGQQHDCGVYECCALNTCENSGIRRWGIFLFWDSVSLFLKNNSHYMFFLTELPSIDWTRNVFSLSPYFCPQMSYFALFSWFIFSSFVHFWRLSALCWR